MYHLFACFLCCFCFSIGNLSAQYADKHYIAPSPWVYFTGAYEFVLSTEFAGTVNVTVTKSDGTPLLTTTVSQGNPNAFRFTGNPAGVLNHPINTVLNDVGVIITGSQPIAVNVRNITSDQVAVGNCIDSKGNSSLTSFGNEGLGISFQPGYYRSDLNGVGYCYAYPVVTCAMATANGTDLLLNGAVIATLNAGQSYIFLAPLGTLVEATKPIVVNSGAYVDSPNGCGDGVVDQVAPNSVLDTAYFVVRGLGTVGNATNYPEQTTIVATRPATTVVVNHYNATGGLIGTNNYTLATAGAFVSFHHGDAATQYSSSHIVSSKPIAVYAGSAVSCEVDMSFVPPVGPCAGSFRVETTNFKSYLNTLLPYNGYVLIEDPTALVFLNGTNLETITAPRFQIGTTGYYMIRFNEVQIGSPLNILINSSVRMNISIVQQGGGFSMSAFFSSFNEILDPPTLAPNGRCQEALLTAEPGYNPYQWYLDEVAIPGATNQTYVATTSGNYSVAGTRPCGLTKPSVPVFFDDSATTPNLAVLVPDTLKCNRTSVVLTASSTAPGATYNWGGSNTNPTYSVFAPGNYVVTVTEPINNCDTSTTIVVAQNIAPPNASIAPPAVINCNTSTVNLMASSTTTGTTYAWGGGNNTNTRTVNAAGTYTVTATDPGNGCTATASETVVAIPLIGLTETHVNVNCFGANTGSINVSVVGGQAPLAYAWSHGPTTQDVSTLIAGTYTLTVTDAQLCDTTISITITQPTAALTLDTNLTQVACFGAATGAIDLIPAGGTTPYSYAWSNAAITQDLSNVVAGLYTVTTTDANSCTAVLSATLTQPASGLSATSAVTNTLCFGGNDGDIDLSPVGGTVPYTFAWSNTATSEDLTNVIAGTYTVTITDASNCSITHTATITQPADLTLNLTPTNVNCFGQSTGAITSTVAGGTTSYGYLWSNAATTQNLSGAIAGSYTLTVTDANGCTETATATITQPTAALTLDTNLTQVACFGAATGAVDLIPAGGTLPYGYVWSNTAITQDLTNVVAGLYTVTTTDANSCTAVLSATLTQPASGLSATSAVTNTLCFGGTDGDIDLSPVGGIAPYTFAWSNTATSEDLTNVIAGTYTVTITDASSCTLTHTATITQPTDLVVTLTPTAVACFGESTGEITSTVTGGTTSYGYLWSNAAITPDVTTLGAGSFTLTVTDANGCQEIATTSITEPVAALTLDTNLTQVACFGGSTGAVDLIPAGGTVPYGYAWSNAAITQDLTAQPAGLYTLTVTDNNGCTATLSATLTQPATALSATSTTTNVSCFNGNDGGIDLTPADATAPYTFGWSNNSTSEDLTGIFAGGYTVTITDANGCTISNSATITEPTQLTVTLAISGIGCNGDTEADITSIVVGGVPTYTYLWSETSTTANLTAVGEGNYLITVTDLNSCTATATADVVFPPAISFSYAVIDVSCFGFNDGFLDLTFSGGTGAITANWANGEYPDNNYAGIAPGSYTINLIDDNGCDTSFAFMVIEPAAISVDILPIDTLRLGLTDTLFTNSVTNPGTISYYWEPAAGLSCDNCAAPEVEVYWDTEFTVTIDNNGCRTTDTILVIVDSDHILYIPNAFSPNGDGRNDLLYVYAKGVKRTVWSVFDRWGEVVFTSTDINAGWDGTMNGKKMPPGVFVIDVYIEFYDLTSERKAQSVTLLR